MQDTLLPKMDDELNMKTSDLALKLLEAQTEFQNFKEAAVEIIKEKIEEIEEMKLENCFLLRRNGQLEEEMRFLCLKLDEIEAKNEEKICQKAMELSEAIRKSEKKSEKIKRLKGELNLGKNQMEEMAEIEEEASRIRRNLESSFRVLKDRFEILESKKNILENQIEAKDKLIQEAKASNHELFNENAKLQRKSRLLEKRLEEESHKHLLEKGRLDREIQERSLKKRRLARMVESYRETNKIKISMNCRIPSFSTELELEENPESFLMNAQTAEESQSGLDQVIGSDAIGLIQKGDEEDVVGPSLSCWNSHLMVEMTEEQLSIFRESIQTLKKLLGKGNRSEEGETREAGACPQGPESLKSKEEEGKTTAKEFFEEFLLIQKRVCEELQKSQKGKEEFDQQIFEHQVKLVNLLNERYELQMELDVLGMTRKQSKINKMANLMKLKEIRDGAQAKRENQKTKGVRGLRDILNWGFL